MSPALPPDDVRRVLDHPSVVRVCTSLEELGARAEVVVLDGAARTAALASEQLGVGVGQIANSIVFSAGGDPLLVLTSGAHRVDTTKVAGLLDLDHLDRADAAFVKDRTGFAIGGVAPVGHTEPVRTLVDVALAEYDEVWAAAGHPRTVFRTTYAELMRLTGGGAADVA